MHSDPEFPLLPSPELMSAAWTDRSQCEQNATAKGREGLTDLSAGADFCWPGLCGSPLESAPNCGFSMAGERPKRGGQNVSMLMLSAVLVQDSKESHHP